AFAGDDRREATNPTKKHHALARRRGWRGGVALAWLARCGAPGWRPPRGRGGGLFCARAVAGRPGGVPIEGWSLTPQFLLGRPHGGNRVRRLMLRFREVLDVFFERLDLLSQPVDLLLRCRALRVFRGRRLQLQSQPPVRIRPSKCKRTNGTKSYS